MKNVPGRAISGLRNAVVFGRMVTWALQNLRGSADDFDVWYDSEQARMRADPLMVYFSDLRTKIEKQAHSPANIAFKMHSFSSADLGRMTPKPDGATRAFLGDQEGGSGWLVPDGQGGFQKFYTALPTALVSVEVRLWDIDPNIALGRSADQLVSVYLDSLAAIVKEARRRFL